MSVVEGLEKSFSDYHIRIPRWEWEDDGITVLSGPSGAGKTTLLRMLVGLESCPGLSWIFQEQDIAKLPLRDKRLGVVTQDYDLFPHMTGRENIAFALQARKLPMDESDEILGFLIETLELNKFWLGQADHLSGGESQRIAIARALVARPRYLLLDEPFSALDSYLKGEARKLLLGVVSRLKIPTLLITHDEQDIKFLASRTFVLNNGGLSSVGN